MLTSEFVNDPRIRKVLENKSNMEDDKVAIIEAQLAQAKQIADEADRKYEEVKCKTKNEFGHHRFRQTAQHIFFLHTYILRRWKIIKISKAFFTFQNVSIRF